MTIEKMAETLRTFASDCHSEAVTIKDGEWFRGFFQGRGDAFNQAAYFIETYLEARWEERL